jgi:hypothetical protein
MGAVDQFNRGEIFYVRLNVSDAMDLEKIIDDPLLTANRKVVGPFTHAFE